MNILHKCLILNSMNTFLMLQNSKWKWKHSTYLKFAASAYDVLDHEQILSVEKSNEYYTAHEGETLLSDHTFDLQVVPELKNILKALQVAAEDDNVEQLIEPDETVFLS